MIERELLRGIMWIRQSNQEIWGKVGEEMDNREKKHAVTEKDIKTIIEFIESVQFGSVSIIIQNGKIVQIEKNEKMRLN